jgi:hypothetical protein
MYRDHFAMLEATRVGDHCSKVDIHSLEDGFPLAVPFTMVAAGPIWARVRRR